MTPVSLKGSNLPESNVPPAATRPTAVASSQPADTLQLSPIALAQVRLTGRVALDEHAGELTGTQAQQIYGQLSSIHSQIATERQADGGTLSSTDALAIRQAQTQSGQTIYSDTHNGAAPPSGATASPAAERQSLEAGRIVLNEKAGNLTSGQAKELGSQLGTIQQQIATDTQADGGKLSASDAQAINQLQDQLSQQIRATAQGYAVGPEPIVNPA